MNDTGVLHRRHTLRSHAVPRGSIRLLPSIALEVVDLPIDGLSTHCEDLTDRLDHGTTRDSSRAQTPRCTAAAAKIPIPT
jgi:hypothetical protein